MKSSFQISTTIEDPEGVIDRILAPSVCAVMLTANRPEMAKQAVASFRAQTYQNKRLSIWDTGDPDGDAFGYSPKLQHVFADKMPTIGALRNAAIAHRQDYGQPEIIVTWDSDDLSHPNRIAEQVALLQSSGADVVGYHEALFWREPVYTERNYRQEVAGEAWLYRNPDPRYAIGSSLCYWRKTWERNPFPATSHGEDAEFIRRLNCVGISSAADPISPITACRLALADVLGVYGCACISCEQARGAPRLLCRIHPGNTSTAYAPHKLKLPEWRRVPEWDDYCAREFAK